MAGRLQQLNRGGCDSVALDLDKTLTNYMLVVYVTGDTKARGNNEFRGLVKELGFARHEFVPEGLELEPAGQVSALYIPALLRDFVGNFDGFAC